MKKNIKSSYLVLPFGKDTPPKALSLVYKDGGYFAQILVSKRTDRRIPLGADVPKEDLDGHIIAFGFKERVDWDTFVKVVKEQDEIIRQREGDNAESAVSVD